MNNDLVKFDELVSDLTVFVSPIKDLVVTDKTSCDKANLTLKELKFWEKKIEEKRKEMVGPLNDQVKRINEYAKTVTAPLATPESHLKAQLMAYERLLEKEREEQRRIEREAQAKREAEARAVIDKQQAEARALIAKQQAEAAEAARQAQEDAEALAMFAEPDESEQIKAKAEQEAKEIAAKAEAETARIQAEAHMQAQKTEFEAKQAHWDVSKDIKANKVIGATRRWTFEVLDESLLPREFLIADEKKIRTAMHAGAREIPGVRIFQELSISNR